MLATNQSAARRRLLLTSDQPGQSAELAAILHGVGDVEHISTANLPDDPPKGLAGLVVDINLRSVESVQRVRQKLRGKAYQAMPRLFVIGEALHHGSMQAWALGATDTIARPFDASSILQRIRAAFPDAPTEQSTDNGKSLQRGVEAACAVLSKLFIKLPAGTPLDFKDVMQAESTILKAIKRTSLRDWLAIVNRHHNHSYRHCLFVTGFAVAFAQHLGMREEDQRRLTRAALIADVGKAFVPLAILDHPGKLSAPEMEEMRKHPRFGYEALEKQKDYPPEMLDVVLHHHELLDGSGYPDQLAGGQISDIVRLMTIIDIFTALIETRSYRAAYTREMAFRMMEGMGGKLDQQLLQAFRPVATGTSY